MTSKPLTIRMALIAFFLGLNIVLGKVFLEETQVVIPTRLQPLLQVLHIQPDASETKTEQEGSLFDRQRDPNIIEQELAQALNEFRSSNGVSPLLRNPTLDDVAELLVKDEKAEQHLSSDQAQQKLNSLLDEAGYLYLAISHNSVVGPTTTSGFVQAILGHEQQSQLLLEAQYTEIGVAVLFADSTESEEGRLVYLLGESYQKRSDKLFPQSTSSTSVPEQKQFPFISNTEVLLALNQYRADHHIHALVEEQHLCAYAEKRLSDQIIFEGLDGHSGFKADFEHNQVPLQLSGYSGTTIGENLAYQHCRNMQTGDSFVAQTAAALIEWCFDSSTKGHREAQLNTDYNNVCVRNADGYFVVIFGE